MSRMWVFSAVSCALVISGCVTPMPVSPEAMQAAQCLAKVLADLPETEATAIGTATEWPYTYPIVRLDYRLSSGVRGRTWLEVMTPVFALYPFRKGPDSPLTADVLDTIQESCGIGIEMIFVT